MGWNGQVWASVASMLASQDEGGAFVASPDFAQYRYCWLRDASFVAYALDRVGKHEPAAHFHRWVDRTIGSAGIGPLIEKAIDKGHADTPRAPGELPPARFSLDGRLVNDDWPSFQIDGYGTWLWSLETHLAASGDDSLLSELLPTVERVARYLSTFAFEPCFDVWEENPGQVHTSTLASVYAGLLAASSLLGDPSFWKRAQVVRDSMNDRARQLGRFVKSSGQEAVDGSLLWLGPAFHVVDADDAHLGITVQEIEETLSYEGGLRRYAADTYFGGGAWPLLTCSLGWYYAWVGRLDDAERCLAWAWARVDEHGRLAEQFGGELRDPTHYREWVERWGNPARDLLWSHAMCVLLATEIEAASQTRVPDAGAHGGAKKGADRWAEEA